MIQLKNRSLEYIVLAYWDNIGHWSIDNWNIIGQLVTDNIGHYIPFIHWSIDNWNIIGQ